MSRRWEEETHGWTSMTAPLLSAVAGPIVLILGALALLWLGLRNGDRTDDVRTSTRLRRVDATRLEVVVDVVNPGRRPVMVSVRSRSTNRLRARLGDPYGVRTRLAARTTPPAEDAVLVGVPAESAQEVSLLLDAEPRRAVRVDVVAYERVGRVRAAAHVLPVPRDAPLGVRSPQQLRAERGTVPWT